VSITLPHHLDTITRWLTTSRFPDVLKRPASDSAWSLPVLTLNKLKPLRDASYLCRSIPDMTQYRLAHLLIKAWAKSRGLYGPKFGLLGGIHITCLLVPVVKMIANEVGRVSVGDIIVTFFHHYANVDWKTQIVLDPFFHSDGINHRRLEREAMCLMGWHAPGLNTALNASAPTVHTIATELSRANSVLSQSDISWGAFLGQQDADMGAADFLKGHILYIRIDVNYWGSSSQKRNGLVGWLESRCVMLLVGKFHPAY
jgi:poly(A) polymerase Pap1